MKGALPEDWPGVNFMIGGGKKGRGEDGLEVGITIAIVAVAAVVVALLGFVLYQKKRQGNSGRVNQNAPKDHSEALQLDVDGSVLQEAVQSNSI